MRYYIYKITNCLNGKCYIGQHKVPLKQEPFMRYMGKGIAIREAIKKYGKSNFTKEILENIDDDEKHILTSEREKYWIKKFNTLYPNGYNLSPGGEGGCTKETAKKIVESRRKHGYVISDETKKKISKAKKGQKFSDEHKRSLSKHHHLKTLHIIIFKDGRKEQTYKSMFNIAKKYNTNVNSLLRYSSRKEFINGIMLEGIEEEMYACCKYIKSERVICRDPIIGDITTIGNLYKRKKKNLDIYADISPKACIIEEVPHEIQSDC